MHDKYKLAIELIPKSSWYDNVRSLKTESEWKAIKSKVYQKAGYRCQICNGKGDKWPVECHEIWEYDISGVKARQILKGLVALCPNCHTVKHFGLAQILGKEKMAADHFCKINKVSKDELEIYLEYCFKQWKQRSVLDWEVDINYLETL